MVKITKYFNFIFYFSTFLTIFFLNSCSKSYYQSKSPETRNININDQISETVEITNFIEPYKVHINKDLDSILCYNPENLDKSKGKWQTNIGNFFAITSFQEANPIFEKKHNKNIDICFLNHGGIRSVIAKGQVTARNAYEIMPFENNLVVVEISKKNLQNLIHYIIKEKKPHPLYGLSLTLNFEGNELVDFTVNNSEANKESYFILTSDYLANGGDNMDFFLNPIQYYDLDYKLRNVFIDYFKKTDTLAIYNQTPIQVLSKN